MNRVHPELGSQSTRQRATINSRNDKLAKEASMSRLSSAKPVQIALRRWLRIDASRVSIALVAACSALCLTTGCSSVGGTNLLKSPIANSPATAAMKSGGAANATCLTFTPRRRTSNPPIERSLQV